MKMTFPIWVALFLVMATPPAAFADADPAPPGFEHLASVTWGEGDSELRHGGLQDVGDGVPSSFLMDESGKLHLLDTIGRRVLMGLSGQGVREETLVLDETGLLSEDSLLTDFVRDRDGVFHILDSIGGTVLRVDPRGPSGRYGLFHNGAEIGLAPDGRILVRDAGLPGVSEFSETGQFLREWRGPDWTVVMDADGRLYHLDSKSAEEALLSRSVSPDSTREAVITIRSHGPDLELAGSQLLGSDSLGRLYVETIEARNEKWQFSSFARIGLDGRIEKELRAPVSPENYGLLPRFSRPTPAGDILTFRTRAGTGYNLMLHRFPR